MDEADLKEQSMKFRHIMTQMKTALIKFQPMKELSMGEYALLKEIAEIGSSADGGELNVSALAEYMNMSKPALSRMLSSLEEREYIRRICLKSDRRSSQVTLSREGELILEKEKQFYLNAIERIAARMGKSDLEQLLNLNEKLVQILLDECS